MHQSIPAAPIWPSAEGAFRESVRERSWSTNRSTEIPLAEASLLTPRQKKSFCWGKGVSRGWEMPGPRAAQNFQMPHPGIEKAGKCPTVARGGEGGGLDSAGIDWCINKPWKLLDVFENLVKSVNSFAVYSRSTLPFSFWHQLSWLRCHKSNRLNTT